MHKVFIGDASDYLNFICFSTPSRGLRRRELLRSPFRSTCFDANDPLLKMIYVYKRLGLSADFNKSVSQRRQHIQVSSRGLLQTCILQAFSDLGILPDNFDLNK